MCGRPDSPQRETPPRGDRQPQARCVGGFGSPEPLKRGNRAPPPPGGSPVSRRDAAPVPPGGRSRPNTPFLPSRNQIPPPTAASPWPRWSWRLDPRSLGPPPPAGFRPGERRAPPHPGTPEREPRRPTPSTGPPPAPGRNRSVTPFRPCTCSERRGCRSWHAPLRKAWREWPAPW